MRKYFTTALLVIAFISGVLVAIPDVAPISPTTDVEEPYVAATPAYTVKDASEYPLPVPLVLPQLYARVNVLGLRVRSEARIDSDILAVMVSGDIVPILEYKDAWIKVQFGDVQGWASSPFVEVIETFEVTGNTAEVAQSLVNVPWTVDCYDIDPYNGYYYHGDCLPGVVDSPSRDMSYPKYSYGGVAHYAEGIMEHVIANGHYDMTGYKDGVALQSCKEVGKTINIFIGGRWDGPFLVVDCGARSGVFRTVVYNKVAIEIGWKTYQRWMDEGIWGGGISICKGGGCVGAPVNFRDYFLGKVQFLTAPESGIELP